MFFLPLLVPSVVRPEARDKSLGEVACDVANLEFQSDVEDKDDQENKGTHLYHVHSQRKKIRPAELRNMSSPLWGATRLRSHPVESRCKSWIRSLRSPNVLVS